LVKKIIIVKNATAYTWDWYCHLVVDRASFTRKQKQSFPTKNDNIGYLPCQCCHLQYRNTCKNVFKHGTLHIYIVQCNSKEKNNENVNKNSLFPLKIKILVANYFSVAIYNAEKCKKMPLKMEHCTFT
jgi:hypothetical protein